MLLAKNGHCRTRRNAEAGDSRLDCSLLHGSSEMIWTLRQFALPDGTPSWLFRKCSGSLERNRSGADIRRHSGNRALRGRSRPGRGLLTERSSALKGSRAPVAAMSSSACGEGVLLIFKPAETVKPPAPGALPVPPHGTKGNGPHVLPVAAEHSMPGRRNWRQPEFRCRRMSAGRTAPAPSISAIGPATAECAEAGLWAKD